MLTLTFFSEWGRTARSVLELSPQKQGKRYIQGSHLRVQGHPTYTPRTIIFDTQGSLGGVHLLQLTFRAAALDALPNPSSCTGMQSREHVTAPPTVSTWAGPVAVHRASPVPRSTFVEQLEYEEEESPDAGAGVQCLQYY